MKTYEIVEPTSEYDMTPRYLQFNEEEILEMYYQHWQDGMEKVGEHKMISKENCIADWVVCNWAYEISPQVTK